VKTNLLFFTKGQPTKTIWYYDLSDGNVGKKTPFTRDKLAEFFKLLPSRGDSDRSWTVDIAERRRKARHAADALRATANDPKARLKRDQEELDCLKPVGRLAVTS
jgi:type I restriction enzyme M protein